MSVGPGEASSESSPEADVEAEVETEEQQEKYDGGEIPRTESPSEQES